LPTQVQDIPGPGELPSPEEIVRIMRQDKKVRRGRLALVLLRGIGDAFVTRDVEADYLVEFLGRATG